MKNICMTSLVLNSEQEERLIQAIRDATNSAFIGMGVRPNWNKRDMPEPYSWAWFRCISEMSFENDFTWRINLPSRSGVDQGIETMKIFNNSNLSMNTPADHYRRNRVDIKAALLKDHRFFGAKYEGEEDQGGSRAISYIQRFLRTRSKRGGFKSAMDSSLTKAMLGGEQVVIPTYATRTKNRSIKSRVVLTNESDPLIDSNGIVVTEKSEWRYDDETKRDVLVQDPTISKAAGQNPKLSKNEVRIITPEIVKAGAEFDRIDFRDFICDPKWSSIDVADFKANDSSMTLDEIKIALERYGEINEDRWREYEKKAKDGSSELAAKDQAKTHTGEVDEDSVTQTTGAGSRPSVDGMQPRNLIRQVFISIDILGTGSRLDLWVLFDVANEIPLAYNYADEIIIHDRSKNHPYIVIRSEDIPDRWYGRPIYQEMFDDLFQIDARLNQINLEYDSSGNMVFVNGKFIKGWERSKKLNIRSKVPNEVNGADPREAVYVQTIQPQVADIEQSLNLSLQRVASKGGLATAGNPMSQALPATDTATGQSILEKAKNSLLEDKVSELAKGIDACIEAYTKIELDNINEAELVSLIGQAGAAEVAAWIESHKGNYDDAIEIVIAAITDSTTIGKNMQAMQIIQNWMQWPQAYQAIHKPLFEKLLTDLDVDDPGRYLKTIQEVTKNATTQQQPEQEQPNPQIQSSATVPA